MLRWVKFLKVKTTSHLRFWSSYMIHSIKNGILKNIKISSFLKKELLKKYMDKKIKESLSTMEEIKLLEL